LISVDAQDDEPQEWFEIPDPKTLKSRIMLVNERPITMRYIAEKIAQKDVFQNAPQQSDYTATWSRHEALSTNNAEAAGGTVRMLIRKFVPYRIKVIANNLKDIVFKEKIRTTSLGMVDPEQFRKVEI
ncbi:MAG: hypothetical protein ACKOYC_10705, partial [Bacteroidota bacterium]